jgi:hypothetical protein
VASLKCNPATPDQQQAQAAPMLAPRLQFLAQGARLLRIGEFLKVKGERGTYGFHICIHLFVHYFSAYLCSFRQKLWRAPDLIEEPDAGYLDYVGADLDDS